MLQYTSSCTAVRPPFVLLYFPGFLALKEGEPRNMPICTAVHLLRAQQCNTHLHGSTFQKVRGVGVSANFLKNRGPGIARISATRSTNMSRITVNGIMKRRFTIANTHRNPSMFKATSWRPWKCTILSPTILNPTILDSESPIQCHLG